MATPQTLDFSDLGAKPVPVSAQAGSSLDFSDLGGKRVGTAQPSATISAGRAGIAQWFEDLGNDIRYGDEQTLPGKILHRMGAPGINRGVPEAVADTVGGPLIGPVTVGHGVATLPSHPVRGANEIVRGVGETLAPVLGATNPEFLPSLATYGTMQQGVKRGAIAAGMDPENAELLANTATAAVPAVKAGAPAVGRFVERNAPTIGKVVGAGDAIAAGAAAVKSGHPVAALPAAGAAYRYTTPMATRLTAGVGRAAQASADYPLPNPFRSGVIARTFAETPAPGSEDLTPILQRSLDQVRASRSNAAPVPSASKPASALDVSPESVPKNAPRLEPKGDIPLPNVIHGESAARHWLSYLPEMDLRQIAGKRGIDVLGTDKPALIIDKIVNSMNESELQEFADQAMEQNRFPRHTAAETQPPKPGSIATAFKKPRAR